MTRPRAVVSRFAADPSNAPEDQKATEQRFALEGGGARWEDVQEVPDAPYVLTQSTLSRDEVRTLAIYEPGIKKFVIVFRPEQSTTGIEQFEFDPKAPAATARTKLSDGNLYSALDGIDFANTGGTALFARLRCGERFCGQAWKSGQPLSLQETTRATGKYWTIPLRDGSEQLLAAFHYGPGSGDMSAFWVSRSGENETFPVYKIPKGRVLLPGLRGYADRDARRVHWVYNDEGFLSEFESNVVSGPPLRIESGAARATNVAAMEELFGRDDIVFAGGATPEQSYLLGQRRNASDKLRATFVRDLSQVEDLGAADRGFAASAYP